MKVECPRCHTHVDKPASGNPVCPTCGFGAGAGAAPPPAAAAAAAPAAPETARMPGAAPAYGAPASAGWAPAGSAPNWQGGQPAQKNQTMAIVALVLGIVGCCIIPVLPSIAAIVVGALAMKKVKAQPEVYGGNGMALAGLILGILGTIAGILMIIFYAAIFAMIADCEENPDTEFCQDLEESNQPAQTYPAPLWSSQAIMAATPLMFTVPRRHAG